MDGHIREITKSDAQGVMAVARRLHGPQGWFNTAGLEYMAIDLRSHRGWVAVVEGRIAGFLTCFTYEGIGHLSWMGVDPARHRCGIGRELVRRFESAMRAVGIKRLQVYTLGDSVDYAPYVRTRAFYRAMGFKDYKREKLDNPACPEALYLRKSIRATPKSHRPTTPTRRR